MQEVGKGMTWVTMNYCERKRFIDFSCGSKLSFYSYSVEGEERSDIEIKCNYRHDRKF